MFDFLKDKRNIEVVYVNDGSLDQTSNVLKIQVNDRKKSLNSSISFVFVDLEENQGKGGAIKKGVLISTGQIVLYTDFDFAISLKEVIPFYEILINEYNCKAAVIASRIDGSIAIKSQSVIRKLLGRVFNYTMKLIVNIPVKDTQCGFKMFDSQTAKNVFKKVELRGFAFDVEALWWCQKMKTPIVPTGVRIRHDDKYSTVNVFLDPFRMIWDLLKFRWRSFFL